LGLFLPLDEFNTLVKLLATLRNNLAPTVITPACITSKYICMNGGGGASETYPGLALGPSSFIALPLLVYPYQIINQIHTIFTLRYYYKKYYLVQTLINLHT
jgi:hypothetical protein